MKYDGIINGFKKFICCSCNCYHEEKLLHLILNSRLQMNQEIGENIKKIQTTLISYCIQCNLQCQRIFSRHVTMMNVPLYFFVSLLKPFF